MSKWSPDDDEEGTSEQHCKNADICIDFWDDKVCSGYSELENNVETNVRNTVYTSFRKAADIGSNVSLENKTFSINTNSFFTHIENEIQSMLLPKLEDATPNFCLKSSANMASSFIVNSIKEIGVIVFSLSLPVGRPPTVLNKLFNDKLTDSSLLFDTECSIGGVDHAV